MSDYVAVSWLWTGRDWAADALLLIDDAGIRPAPPDVTPARTAGRLDLIVLPPLTDAHVHIGLSDFSHRGGGALARVLDLGWIPAELSTMVPVAADRWPGTEVLFAGAFLTTVGGYPATREWAPPGSTAELASAPEAARAVELHAAIGATVIKVTLNIDAGPVLPDDVLAAVVAAAHARRLPVVAHVEGEGQAVRALRAGVDAFAHTPWTERLSDGDIAAMASSMTWISTLDMHGRGTYDDGYGRALDNLTRFAAAGGAVVYGTDLGNAIATTELNVRELDGLAAAGVAGGRLLQALAATRLLPTWSRTVSVLPGVARLPDADALIGQLPSARPVGAAQLSEYLT